LLVKRSTVLDPSLRRRRGLKARSAAFGLCPAGNVMRLSDIVTPAAIAVQVRLEDKAHALKFAASLLGARSGLDPDRVCQALAAREALGSTGIGKGVAVPHVCFPDLDRPYALLCTLANPIGFDAIDGKPVDLIFTVITPTGSKGCNGGEALPYLAALSRILRDAGTAQALRHAKNTASVYDIIVRPAVMAAQPLS
jgi:nitrogen PTS system EIIA component